MTDILSVQQLIRSGQTALGIEFGSTRIKAVLVDKANSVLASGSHIWENSQVNGIWTYSQSEIISGLQATYKALKEDVANRFHVKLEKIGSIGISAMMHGYIALDKEDSLLVPFQTWRNNHTADAAESLTELFQFHIPLRWTIAHLYQAILDEEPHLQNVNRVTTLAGYIHYLLTGEFVLGIGDASGVFPIDSQTKQYVSGYLGQFNELMQEHGLSLNLESLLPAIKQAGEEAGCLTQEGAELLDPSSDLEAGIPFCPPEGDAGTGMVATNAIRPKTGNISAGTSIFSMVVLEKDMKHYYPEIDMVTTPEGHPVAMVHANNCSSELNSWASLFEEFVQSTGLAISKEDIYTLLFRKMTEGKVGEESIVAYPFHSGEDLVGVERGYPLLVRKGTAALTLGNLMKSQLYAAFASLAIGMELLTQEEGITIDSLLGHGGIFTTPLVAQSLLAAAINVPISVMDTASEGGAWGMAILANFSQSRFSSLQTYLDEFVFAGMNRHTVQPDEELVQEFQDYLSRFKKALFLAQEVGQILD